MSLSANRIFRISAVIADDLQAIMQLQPNDWADIMPSIQFYCSSDFCFPMKVTIDNAIVGIGTAIVFGETAWLAHIIVHPDFRKMGIGTFITQALVDLIFRKNCKTALLIATTLGEPVYKKAGFRVQTKYIFFDEGCLPPPTETVEKLIFQKQYEPTILQLDREVSGESRNKLLAPHLSDALIILKNSQIDGFFLPTLGEGLIVARTNETGMELMKVRAIETKKFCLPEENLPGVQLLRDSGFKELRKASRMILGKDIPWHGPNMYNRIGGNLG